MQEGEGDFMLAFSTSVTAASFCLKVPAPLSMPGRASEVAVASNLQLLLSDAAQASNTVSKFNMMMVQSALDLSHMCSQDVLTVLCMDRLRQLCWMFCGVLRSRRYLDVPLVLAIW